MMRVSLTIWAIVAGLFGGLAGAAWAGDEPYYPVLDTLTEKGFNSLNSEVQNALSCQETRRFWNGSACVPRTPGRYNNINIVRETEALTATCAVSCPICSARGHGGTRCHVYYERSCDAAAMKPELRVQGDTARVIDKTCSGAGSTYVGYFPPIACSMGCS